MKTDEVWYILAICAIIVIVIVYAMTTPLGDNDDKDIDDE